MGMIRDLISRGPAVTRYFQVQGLSREWPTKSEYNPFAAFHGSPFFSGVLISKDGNDCPPPPNRGLNLALISMIRHWWGMPIPIGKFGQLPRE